MIDAETRWTDRLQSQDTQARGWDGCECENCADCHQTHSARREFPAYCERCEDEICSDCNGRGYIDDGNVECSSCAGLGRIV